MASTSLSASMPAALRQGVGQAAPGSHHAARSRLHRLPIGNGRVKKSSTDHAVVSSSLQTALEKSISRVTPDKNGSIRAPKTGRVSRSPAEIWSACWRQAAPHCPADQMPTCSRVFEAAATAL